MLVSDIIGWVTLYLLGSYLLTLLTVRGVEIDKVNNPNFKFTKYELNVFKVVVLSSWIGVVLMIIMITTKYKNKT